MRAGHVHPARRGGRELMRRISGLRAWLRHPNWAWTVRRAAVLTFVVGVASALLGVGLNAAEVVIPGGLSASQGRREQWLMWTTIAAAAVVYAAIAIAYRGRDGMLRRNGTAFIVRERADDWDRDEPDNFYVEVRRRFARVIEVPGPGILAPPWGWPLDARARHWEGRLTGLVRSFQTLYLTETSRTDAAPASATGVFVTAWWPVALALGYRLSAADRVMGLGVWQRFSHGRADKVDPAIWAQHGHRFGGTRNVPAPAGVTRAERVWDAILTVDRSGAAPEVPVPGSGPVSVLLIRFGRRGRSEWGPLPSAEVEPDGLEPLPFTLHDMAGVVPVKGTAPVGIHELSYIPPFDQQFAWDDYPFLVNEAVSWIAKKTTELDGHTLVLGTAMPNEVAIGIGLSAGREDCPGWPRHLWPAVYRKPADALVVPRLDLGRAGAARRGAGDVPEAGELALIGGVQWRVCGWM